MTEIERNETEIHERKEIQIEIPIGTATETIIEITTEIEIPDRRKRS